MTVKVETKQINIIFSKAQFSLIPYACNDFLISY